MEKDEVGTESPEPEPLRRVVMRQTWRRLTFLHWPFRPELIRPFIPTALTLDTFDGSAWLGLVPFEIYGTPLLPYFPETNLRTYVTGPDGSRGVWFFSLDAASPAAVIGARIGYHLPYFWSDMRVTANDATIHYQSRRHWPHASAATNILIQPGPAYGSDELAPRDQFLTARFRLYAISRGRLACAQIEHPPWPLAHATVIQLRQTLTDSIHLAAPSGTPLAHYSSEVSVKIGPLDLH